MKLIIAGSRELDHDCFFIRDEILRHLTRLFKDVDVTEVVCGEARGPDTIGRRWANLYNIPVKSFPADWKQHGKAAGPIRNQEMADYADSCVVFWDGTSTGSRDMIKRAKRKGIPCLVVKVGLSFNGKCY